MSTVQSEPDVVLRIPAAPENVAVVRQALTGLCEALNATPRLIGDVKLAATEACTNVIIHAYRESPEVGRLEVECRATADSLNIIVRDFGLGIAPRVEGGGLGLGLPLIAALATTVEVTGGPGEGGTEVSMTFELPGRDDEAATA